MRAALLFVFAILIAVLLSGCATTADALEGTGVGKASWYHEGARTATGERYDPDGLTTAHRTLPFGTRVRITNMRNGKAVVVRVNDRGPAKWTGRDWDLSRGAAHVVDMIHTGTAAVRWEILR